MPATKPRSSKTFSTLDELLDEDGTREAFRIVAINELSAWEPVRP
jgi:hypothetical protein